MSDAYRAIIGLEAESTAGISITNFTLNESNDAIYFLFQSETASAITHLGCLSGTATSSPVYEISLQGVTDGAPDGTIKGGSNNAKATFTPTSTDWDWKALGESYTPTVGEELAVVLKYSSGTIDASHNCAFSYSWSSSGFVTIGFPYVTTVNAGSATKNGIYPLFGYKTASRTYGFPLASNTSRTWTSASNPNEIAIKFSLPAGWGNTYKLFGLRLPGIVMTAAGTVTLKLYTGGLTTDTGTVTTLVAKDMDNWQAAGGSGRVGDFWFPEQTLNFGDTYRLSFVPSAHNFTIRTWDVDAASDFDGWCGGSVFSYSTRNGGDWTDTATRKIEAGLRLSDWTEPTGGSSGGGPLIDARLVA